MGIVLDPRRPLGEGSGFYVFPTQTDAALWRSSRGLQTCELRKVLSETPFQWMDSTGTLTKMKLANRIFEIRLDHRFEAQPGRAYLAPMRRAHAA